MRVETKADTLALYYCGETSNGVMCHCVITKNKTPGMSRKSSNDSETNMPCSYRSI